VSGSGFFQEAKPWRDHRRGRTPVRTRTRREVRIDGALVTEIFHVLYEDFSTDRNVRVAPSPELTAQEERALLAGELRPDAPVLFTLVSGKLWTDFLSSSTVISNLISFRLVEMLERERVTGWATYRTNVFSRAGALLSADYGGLAVTGRSGPVDDSLSAEVDRLAPKAGGARRVLVGLRFQPGSWDGSDIFLAGGRGFIFVTQRVRELFERERVTNARFKRAEDIERRLPGIISRNG